MLTRHLNFIRFSPFDIRVIVRIAIFLVVWKLLSIDYGAFPELLGGPELFPLIRGLNQAANLWQPLLFDQLWKIQALQGFGAVMLALAFWRLSRVALLAGLAPVMLLEWNAFLYRSQFHDLDIPCALLLIAAVGPWQKSTTGGRVASSPATWTGIAMTAYMGGAYFLSGWSKLEFDLLWWQNVRLDLHYPVMEIWHGQTYPAWLHPIALGAHRFLTAYPDIATIMAGIVLVLELTWWLVLISRTARIAIPPLMLAFHLGFFLGAGTLFLSMAIMGISLVIPWRLLRRAGESDTPAAEPASSPPAWGASCCRWLCWPSGSLHSPTIRFHSRPTTSLPGATPVLPSRTRSTGSAMKTL